MAVRYPVRRVSELSGKLVGLTASFFPLEELAHNSNSFPRVSLHVNGVPASVSGR